ncbi:MAG: YraN family protein [Candidatus Cryptobacteroides sp.]
MKDNRQKVGKEGEKQACLYLEELGHRIVATNWRSGHKELDIISLTEGVLHVVEVKSLTAPVLTDPLSKINTQKMKNLVTAAKAFLNSEERKRLPHDLEVVFDIVSIVFFEDETKIEYYPQAYIPTYV